MAISDPSQCDQRHLLGPSSSSESKKNRACLSCQRSKHKCIPSPTGAGAAAIGGDAEREDETRCVRCAKRGEKCEFRQRFYDEQWQIWATDKINELTRTNELLVRSLQHLENIIHSPQPSQSSQSSAAGIPSASGISALVPRLHGLPSFLIEDTSIKMSSNSNSNSSHSPPTLASSPDDSWPPRIKRMHDLSPGNEQLQSLEDHHHHLAQAHPQSHSLSTRHDTTIYPGRLKRSFTDSSRLKNEGGAGAGGAGAGEGMGMGMCISSATVTLGSPSKKRPSVSASVTSPALQFCRTLAFQNQNQKPDQQKDQNRQKKQNRNHAKRENTIVDQWHGVASGNSKGFTSKGGGDRRSSMSNMSHVSDIDTGDSMSSPTMSSPAAVHIIQSQSQSAFHSQLQSQSASSSSWTLHPTQKVSGLDSSSGSTATTHGLLPAMKKGLGHSVDLGVGVKRVSNSNLTSNTGTHYMNPTQRPFISIPRTNTSSHIPYRKQTERGVFGSFFLPNFVENGNRPYEYDAREAQRASDLESENRLPPPKGYNPHRYSSFRGTLNGVAPSLVLASADKPISTTLSNTANEEGSRVVIVEEHGRPVEVKDLIRPCSIEGNMSMDEQIDGQGYPVLGRFDTRPNLVTKGKVQNAAAHELFHYFHAHAIPQIFGYTLKPEDFPYIKNTAERITPYILASVCLISAERLPEYHHLIDIIKQEVREAYPAEGDNTQPHLLTPYPPEMAAKDKEQLLETDFIAPLCKEYGIGSEEIVAAAVLSAFGAGRHCSDEDMFMLAKSALQWARAHYQSGQIAQAAKEDSETVGEICGVLPPLRRNATAVDISRIKLLCYVNAVHRAVDTGYRPPLMGHELILTSKNPLGDDREGGPQPLTNQDRQLLLEAELGLILVDMYRFEKAHPISDMRFTAQDQSHELAPIVSQLQMHRYNVARQDLDPGQRRLLNMRGLKARLFVEMIVGARALSVERDIHQLVEDILEAFRNSHSAAEDIVMLPPLMLQIFVQCSGYLEVNPSLLHSLDRQQLSGDALRISQIIKFTLVPGHTAHKVADALYEFARQLSS